MVKKISLLYFSFEVCEKLSGIGRISTAEKYLEIMRNLSYFALMKVWDCGWAKIDLLLT